MANVLPRNPTLDIAQRSTFESLWGSSTQWKSSVPRSRRLDIYHPSPDQASSPPEAATPSQRVSSGSVRHSPSRSRPPLNLNKPLPPLPGQTLVVDEEKTLSDGTMRRRSTVSRSLMSYTTMSNAYHGAKKMATFGLVTKKRKALIVPPQRLAVTENSERLSEVPQPSGTLAGLTPGLSERNMRIYDDAARKVHSSPRNRRSNYINRSTQVAIPSPVLAQGTSISLQQFAARPALRPLLSNGSSPGSPKHLSKVVGPADYFHFQSEAIGGDGKATPRGESGRSNRSSRSHRQNSSSSGASSKTHRSAASVGTYESVYSTAEQDVKSSVIQSRRSQARSTSDSTLTVQWSPASVAPTPLSRNIEVSSPSEPKRREQLSDDATRRKSFIPKFTTATQLSRRPRAQHLSDNNGHSPLRQEISAEREADSVPVTPDPADMFRVPVGYVNPAEEPTYTVANVPEHLAGSPLCPLHPKHKSYGTGICPFHGRLSVMDLDDSRSSAKKDGADQDHIPSKLDEKAFELIVPHHSANSVDCPAHSGHVSGGKGLCVYHGRSRLAEQEKPQRPIGSFMWT